MVQSPQRVRSSSSSSSDKHAISFTKSSNSNNIPTPRQDVKVTSPQLKSTSDVQQHITSSNQPEVHNKKDESIQVSLKQKLHIVLVSRDVVIK